jgi:hypothetical protein
MIGEKENEEMDDDSNSGLCDDGADGSGTDNGERQ